MSACHVVKYMPTLRSEEHEHKYEAKWVWHLVLQSWQCHGLLRAKHFQLAYEGNIQHVDGLVQDCSS